MGEDKLKKKDNKKQKDPVSEGEGKQPTSEASNVDESHAEVVSPARNAINVKRAIAPISPETCNYTLIDKDKIKTSVYGSFINALNPSDYIQGDHISYRFLNVKSDSEQRLEKEITDLKSKINEQKLALSKSTQTKANLEGQFTLLQTTLATLMQKETLNFILIRIHDRARDILLKSKSFQDMFLNNSSSDAYIMSIDIRRSTELMLKARRPELFATFISELCAKLRNIILEHNGIFDKFTGDGILAFFPDFYSGEDAGYQVVSAADKCHEAFNEHYYCHRSSFYSILKNVGLGIGIDYGPTHLVQIGDGLSVVGTPVVYACRMGGTKGGTTLLNQPAFEEIFSKFSAYCTFEETDIEVKHEGSNVAYAVKLNGKEYRPGPPKWETYSENPTTEENEQKGEGQ
jgi:class 3 adenylate cyclase